MIKYLFIVLNSISLFILGLFSGDEGIRISHNVPSSINTGKEVQVEFRVAKGELSGFGRLQVEVPEGLTLKNGDNGDLEFSNEENKARWVWAAMPADSIITIRVIFIASESALGERLINARFSYLENNEKQFVDMEPARIMVLPAEGGGQAVIPKTVDTAVAQGSNAEPPGNVLLERVLIKESDFGYQVIVKIKKGNTKGFARFSDDAFENMTAKAIKTDGSSFSVADGKLKFVWVNVPEKDELEISYTLSGKPSGPVELNGEYSYLEDNQSKKVKLNAEKLDLQTRPVETQKPVETRVATGEKEKEKEKEEPKTGGMSKNDGKASYQVQVGAFSSSEVTPERLKRKFGISESIRSEMQGGFSKFMVGQHKEYKGARQHRDAVVSSNNVKSAFVVAYNEGKRITVQEALMVTNQRWFK